MSFADKLVECRTKLGISQRELANRLGVTPVRLNYWEKGKREPDVYYIKALARELGVTGDYLLETPFAEQLEEPDKEPNISPDAMKIALDYDTLDYRGKCAVRSVLDAESAYLKRVNAEDYHTPEMNQKRDALRSMQDQKAQ